MHAKYAAYAFGARIATVGQTCLRFASSSAFFLASSFSSALCTKKTQRVQAHSRVVGSLRTRGQHVQAGTRACTHVLTHARTHA